MTEDKDDNPGINWQSYFNVLFPSLGKVYLSERDMNTVNRSLHERNELLLTRIGSTYATTIYDLMVRIIEPRIGNERERTMALELLTCLNRKTGKLLHLLGNDVQLLHQLKSQMADMFRDNQAKYLEKAGELLSTVHLIKVHPELKIKALEYKHEIVTGAKAKDSKDSDILFENMETKKKVLVDILNISLDFQKIEHEEGLALLIRDRIEKKRKQKLYDDEKILDQFSATIIQPFIWIYDADTITRYKTVLQNLADEKTYPILLLRQRADNGGKLYYDCCEPKDF